MSQGVALTRFPFALPPLFAEQLGYRGDRRFVAVHWEPLGDEVTVRDDRSTATGLGDRYAWGDFFHQRQIRTWLWDQTINFVLAGDVAAIGAADIDPASGQARLSSRRAAELFDEHTGGWTLHQLRHSALTHAAEAGANTSTLLAYSGHTSVTSLARYARVSPDALARWQTSRDPATRRR